MPKAKAVKYKIPPNFEGTVYFDKNGNKIFLEKGKISNKKTDENGMTMPAVISPGDRTEWWKDGVRHRDDLDENGDVLPSIEDGWRKEWWINGVRHRDLRDGSGMVLPAVETYTSKEWWVNGVKHREDRDSSGCLLPAVETNYHKEWWINGIRRRDERDSSGKLKPVIEYKKDRKDGLKIWFINGNIGNENGLPAKVNKYTSVWFVNGKIGRLEKDENGFVLPACIEYDLPGYYPEYTWYVDGKIHNPNKDEFGNFLPAFVSENGQKEWWFHGNHHRDTKDENGDLMPAVIMKNSDKYFIRNGKFDNDVDKDGYKKYNILRIDPWGHKKGYNKEWCNNNCNTLHNIEKGSDGLTRPAKIDADGDQFWYINGRQGRKDYVDGKPLPSVIRSNGTLVWCRNGKTHNTHILPDGTTMPAIVKKCGSMKWLKNGENHRTDKDEFGRILPAVIDYYDGVVSKKMWYLNGKLHRTCKDSDGFTLPAKELDDGKEWWYNGELHRSHGLPAEVCNDGTKTWYINGEKVSEYEAFLYWRKSWYYLVPCLEKFVDKESLERTFERIIWWC